MKSPAFQFYPDDFLGSGKVGTMTTDEVGAYTLLLCLEWNETGFVFDEEELARWCRMSRAKFRKAWQRVSRCFEERDGRMYNPRLQKERDKQAEWREKSAKGGRASAQAKAKGGARVVEAPLVPNANTPVSSLQSPVTESVPPSPAALSPTATEPDASSPVAPAVAVPRTKGAARKAKPAVVSWTAEGSAWWVANVGDMNPGRFGKALSAVVGVFGWPPVFTDLQKWVAEQKGGERAVVLTWYADRASARLTASPPPMYDYERMELTPYGERMTRPDAKAVA
ncbi:DUF1376 domain-containing protein [Humibacter sp.]|uniref:DUF1376 domain-containing protein n=1 Tax=Humibacter sp. TaxID=1940291 RepID=UPI003F7D676A